MNDPGKVTKHQLEELGLPKPLDEFEVVDETSEKSSPRETLLSHPEVGAVAAVEALKQVENEQINKSVNEQGVNEQINKSVNEQVVSDQTVEVKVIESQPIVQPTTNNQQLTTTTKDPEVARIEETISAGLKDEYMKMAPNLQQKFRVEGEKTAQEINKLLHKTKINIRKIISLIRKWLSLIPGVSKYFLDQEAKIKGDAVVKNSSK